MRRLRKGRTARNEQSEKRETNHATHASPQIRFRIRLRPCVIRSNYRRRSDEWSQRALRDMDLARGVSCRAAVNQWSDWGERHGRWEGTTTWAECLAVERCGKQPRYNGATGVSDMAGKAAQVAVERCGKQPRYNGATGAGGMAGGSFFALPING
jgi:hypothetical protein